MITTELQPLRSESEMMELILRVARDDDRIRAVYMNGSRTNPTIPRDRFQDYDIVYVVTETLPYVNNPAWISVFGETLIVQEPDRVDWEWGIESDAAKQYAWLMLFADGNRIDLTIQTPNVCRDAFLSDKLCRALLDKDGMLPPIPAPTDVEFHVQPPTHGQFEACCNEFWWCLGNVAKGLARDEMPNAMWMLNTPVRDMLMKMLDWSVGVDTDFALSTGKQGKFLKRYLSESDYAKLLATWQAGSIDDAWEAVSAMTDLFQRHTRHVADHFAFPVNTSDEDGMLRYLASVRGISRQLH